MLWEKYLLIMSIFLTVVRKVIDINDLATSFAGNTCGIISSINSQSINIAMGVNHSLEIKNGNEDVGNEIRAGDQGTVFGFACDETPELMPLPISLAHELTKQLALVRKEQILKYLFPDGKTQVTVEYDNDTPIRVDTIVISA